MLPEIDQTVFDRNLLLTQAYCELQLQKPFENNAKVLRTINSEINGVPTFSFAKERYGAHEWNKPNWDLEPFGSNDHVFQNLFDKQLILKEEAIADVNIADKLKGKILIVLVDETLIDGASEAETDGFIDIYDCSPIDTWFYKTVGDEGTMIFSWIPERFVETVTQGIAVNATEPFIGIITMMFL